MSAHSSTPLWPSGKRRRPAPSVKVEKGESLRLELRHPDEGVADRASDGALGATAGISAMAL
jgi:hypothetical protein